MDQQFSTPISELVPNEQEIHYNDTETMNTNARVIAERLNQELSKPPEPIYQQNTNNVQQLNNLINSKQQQISYLSSKQLKKLIDYNKSEYIILASIIFITMSPQFTELIVNKVSMLAGSNPILLHTLKTVLVIIVYHLVKNLVL